MKLVEVKATKEFASTFLADPILKMAVNAVLDNAPEFETDKSIAMIHEEKYWIDLCRRLPDDFVIMVDNDGAFVQRLADGEVVCEFNNFGWRLALDLFLYIGCNAEEA